MSDRAPCVKCGRILHTGEGRVLVSFTPEELRELAESTGDLGVRSRLVCAMSLLDPDMAKEVG
jgi:hypothetical protein